MKIKTSNELYCLILNTPGDVDGKRSFFATDEFSLYGIPAKFPTMLTFTTIKSARVYAESMKDNWVPILLTRDAIEEINADIYAEYEALGFINREIAAAE